MKLTKKLVALVAAIVASLLGSSTMADSLWQTFEFEEAGGPVYLDCLGENVSLYSWFTGVFREFDTPSGTSHYIEYWEWDTVFTGEDTERIWLAQGQSPGSFQTMKGEVGQWTSQIMAVPFEGDGPRFRFNSRFKYAVNANGDLRVSYVPEDPNNTIRCLGPNR